MNCFDDLRLAAVGAGRIGIGHPDELLEMGLAAHADVFVDRHRVNPTKAAILRLGRTARGTIAAARYPHEELELDMFNDVTVIGAGRAGSAIAARLRERGVAVRDDGELRLLCVPDRAIAEVARAIEPGPWVAHVSGGDAARRARPARAPVLGAPAADADARRAGRSSSTAPGPPSPPRRPRRTTRALWLAETLGLQPVRARRRPARALPRGRVDRVELPRHALPRRGASSSSRQAPRPRRSCR